MVTVRVTLVVSDGGGPLTVVMTVVVTAAPGFIVSEHERAVVVASGESTEKVCVTVTVTVASGELEAFGELLAPLPPGPTMQSQPAVRVVVAEDPLVAPVARR